MPDRFMRKNKDNIIALLLSILGFIYVVYYIFRASTNVVTSDYMRIVNSYLYDVSDLKYLASMESISRIPFTFLARFINVKVFDYNVFFDKILGAFGLLVFNFVTVKYILKTLNTSFIRIITSIIVSFISFSLMSWEMILNGTGYAHFLTIGLIAITFYIFDLFVNCKGESENSRGDAPRVLTCSGEHCGPVIIVLIVVTSLCFAGSYSVSYNCTLIFFSLIYLILIARNKCADSKKKNHKKLVTYICIVIVSIICTALYIISNNTGEPLIPVGFQDISLLELLKTNPSFPIRFILKSLASSIIGVETFDYAINFGTITEKIIYLFGIIYVLIILWTIFVVIVGNFVGTSTVSPQTAEASFTRPPVFALMYVIYGLMNFALVFLARYKFVRDEYGMTSRYALQYMFLSIGIVMLLSIFMDKIFVAKKLDVKNVLICLGSLACIFILCFGNVVTSCDEIYKADYRKIIYTNLIDIAKNSEQYSDEELSNFFEYHRDPEHIRNTFKILKDQKLNIFSNK